MYKYHKVDYFHVENDVRERHASLHLSSRDQRGHQLISSRRGDEICLSAELVS